MVETWKFIPGFPAYEVSNQGRVRSYYKQYGMGKWRIAEEPQRIMHPGKDRLGRKRIGLRLNGETNPRTIASLVLLAFIGPPPDGQEVCHTDGNVSNDNLSNLRYDTRLGNMADRRRNLIPRIIELRQKRAAGSTLKALSKEYNLNASYICSLCTGSLFSGVGGAVKINNSALSRTDILDIRNRRASGATLIELAREYKVHESYVSRISRGKCYAEYGGPFTFGPHSSKSA